MDGHETTFWTYNLKDYRLYPGESARWELDEEVVRLLRADVIAIQEIAGGTPEDAQRCLRRLADATGMVCRLREANGPACAAVPGGHDRLGIGLMWRPEFEPVPGTWFAISGGALWHALVTVQLDVGGRLVTHGSYHAPPRRGARRRPREARIVATALGGRGPALIGGDWNSIGDERVGREHYDPDPNVAVGYSGEQAGGTRRKIPVDRRAARILARRGLVDAAWSVGAKWRSTTGHWPTERNGLRRLDVIRVTADLLPALCDYRVFDDPPAKAASDHLPAGISYLPSAIAANER